MSKRRKERDALSENLAQEELVARNAALVAENARLRLQVQHVERALRVAGKCLSPYLREEAR